MIVLKFGGTSVSSKENLKNILSILKDRSRKDDLLVVISAFSQVTNKLNRMADLASSGNEDYLKVLDELKDDHHERVIDLFPLKEKEDITASVDEVFDKLSDIIKGVYLLRECSSKTRDLISSFGEGLSSTILYAYFNEAEMNMTLIDPTQLIKTDDEFGNASVNRDLTYSNIQNYFSSSSGNHLCPGFLASDDKGNLTTLGRGGSDLTASLFAAAVNATELEIWTDVSGMMSANPSKVALAQPITEMTYEEAMELSHFGAKVLYPPTVQPVFEKDIPIRIKNTKEPESEGTLIKSDPEHDEHIVTGISSIEDIALITLSGSGMIAVPKFSFRLFETLSNAKINVILITQSSSEHTITVAIKAEDADVAKKRIDETFAIEIEKHQVNPLQIENKLAILGLVGRNMKSQIGVSAKLFETLSQNGVNVRAIAQGSTELNISAVIPQEDLTKALNSIHSAFFLADLKKINVFMIGVGNVGSSFINQVKDQIEYLKNEYHLDVQFVGLSNSKAMLFEEDGIDLSNWESSLKKSKAKADPSAFIMKMMMMNKANSIFIDATASEDIPEYYSTILKKSISIVTPNKVASSSSQEVYNELKSLERKFKCRFLYEANVGAGLPIISTIQDMKHSGDEIFSIQAVLSGTLNYIFNTYDGEVPFVSVVKQAKQLGLSEPDPRIDLSGKDVARKLLILARESGKEMEFGDIKMTTFLPAACLKAPTLDNFYKMLMDEEEYFQDLYESAHSRHKRLRFVASLSDKEATIKLEMIPEGHPLYHLESQDNVILIYSKRYKDQPLVVKGAGAGADVTASGIFADVMRISLS